MDTIAETKDYDSGCWYVDTDDDELNIVIRRSPTTADDITKWNILMSRVKSSNKLLLREYYSSDIDYKSFNSECIPILCEALKSNIIIKRLRVFDVLNTVGMEYVFKLLQTHITITEATICYNKSDFSSDIEDMVSLNKTLKTLRVDVGPKSVKFLARALTHNTTLTHLHIHGVNRKMGLEGLKILCKGLRGNHSITKISLPFQGISDEGAKELCSLLEMNHTITEVDLSNNDIIVLPQTFAFLTHLKKLKLFGNSNLRSPPPHVASNQAALFAYFADIRAGSVKLKRLQLVLLGNGGAGKTTLKCALKKVLHQLHSSEASTSSEERKCSSTVLERAIERIDLSAWTVEEVGEFVRDRGFSERVQRVLERNHIDGCILIRQNVKDMVKLGLDTDEQAALLFEITHLKQQLRKQRLNKKKTPIYIETVGITEEIWEIDKELSVRPIDFAGQLQYFVSHELFLSFSPANIPVVANVMVEKDKSNVFVCNRNLEHDVNDWLSFLHANAKRSKDKEVSIGGPSVSIVCTFMDKVGKEVIPDLRALFWHMHEKFVNSVNVTSSYDIDYSAKPDILHRLSRNIRSACIRHAASMKIPSTYARLTELLQQMRAQQREQAQPPLISYVKVREFASRKQAAFKDVKLLNRAMDYNAAIGEVFFDPGRRLAVLSPFSYISRFLSHFLAPESRNPCIPLNKEGIVPLTTIQKKSHMLQCEASKLVALMSLICSLGICIEVPLPGKGVGYLFPSKLPLLEEKERLNLWPRIPKERSSNFFTVGRRIRISGASLPVGAFIKLQVHVYRRCNGAESGKNSGKCSLWGNAIIISHGPYMALVDWRQDADYIDVVIRLIPAHIDPQHRNTSPVMFLGTLMNFIMNALRSYYEGLEFVFEALCYRCLRLNNLHPCAFPLLVPQLRKRPIAVTEIQPSWRLDSRFLPSICAFREWTRLNPEILLTGLSEPSSGKFKPFRFEYDMSVAVVVGIDNYSSKSGLTALTFAVNDATAFARVLKENHKFDIVELLVEEKATHRNILMRVEALQKLCTPTSRLVVFLAGHGSPEIDGFFYTFDSVKDSFFSSMPISDLQRIAKYQRDPLHILFVLDCCFSGKALPQTEMKAVDIPTKTILNVQKVPTTGMRVVITPTKKPQMLPLNLRAIEYITSGASDELVREVGGHGVFTKYLLAGLSGAAFSHKWISAKSLWQWIANKMKGDNDVDQSPCFGSLSKDKGEFVFYRPTDRKSIPQSVLVKIE